MTLKNNKENMIDFSLKINHCQRLLQSLYLIDVMKNIHNLKNIMQVNINRHFSLSSFFSRHVRAIYSISSLKFQQTRHKKTI